MHTKRAYANHVMQMLAICVQATLTAVQLLNEHYLLQYYCNVLLALSSIDTPKSASTAHLFQQADSPAMLFRHFQVCSLLRLCISLTLTAA